LEIVVKILSLLFPATLHDTETVAFGTAKAGS
jgi:hypothetical protein